MMILLFNALINAVHEDMEQRTVGRNSYGWAEDAKHLEFVKKRIREKWRQQALPDKEPKP